MNFYHLISSDKNINRYVFYLALIAFLLTRLPDSSVGKESACNEGDPDLIPWLGRSAREGIGYPLEYT